MFHLMLIKKNMPLIDLWSKGMTKQHTNQTAHTSIYMSPLDSTERIDFANQWKHSADQFGQRSVARSDWVLM